VAGTPGQDVETSRVRIVRKEGLSCERNALV
jgi:hypothetical protein